MQITENGSVIELENLKNKPITGKLELTKLDVSTGKPLPNAGFRIKDMEGNTVAEGYTDEYGIARFTLGYGESGTQPSEVKQGGRCGCERSLCRFRARRHGS